MRFDDDDAGQLLCEVGVILHSACGNIFEIDILRYEARLKLIEIQIIRRGWAEQYYATLCEAGDLDPSGATATWLISFFSIEQKCEALIDVLNEVRNEPNG